MSYLFVILFLFSGVSLLLGLIKPRMVSRFLGANPSRKKVGLINFSALVLFFVLTGLTSSGANKSNTTTSTPALTATPVITQKIQEVEKKKEISYEVVERWSVSDDGEGKAILISPDYLNEADMTALGEKLKSDTQKYRRVFIWVYTDRRAAEMRKRTDELRGGDLDLYDKHFVGQYTKNTYTGHHEFTILFGGVKGTNDKTIKY